MSDSSNFSKIDTLVKSAKGNEWTATRKAEFEADVLQLMQKELPVVAFHVGHKGNSNLIEIIKTSADCVNADVFAFEDFSMQTLVESHKSDLEFALQLKNIPELIAIASANKDKYCTPVLEEYLLARMGILVPVKKVALNEMENIKRIDIHSGNWTHSVPLSKFNFDKFAADNFPTHVQQEQKVQNKSNLKVQATPPQATKVQTVIAELNAIAKEASSIEWNEQNQGRLSAMERDMHFQLSLIADVQSVYLRVIRNKKQAQITLNSASSRAIGIVSQLPMHDFQLNANLFAPYCAQEGIANPYDFLQMPASEFKEANKMDAIELDVDLFPNDLRLFDKFAKELDADIINSLGYTYISIPLKRLHKYDALVSTTEFEAFGSVKVQNEIDRQFSNGLHTAGLPYSVTNVQRPYLLEDDSDFRQIYGKVQLFAGKSCTLIADLEQTVGVQNTFAKYAQAIASELRIDLVPAQDNAPKLQCQAKEFEDLDVAELLELHEHLCKDEESIAHDFISKQHIAFKLQKKFEPIVGKNKVTLSDCEYPENDIAIKEEETGKVYSYFASKFDVKQLQSDFEKYTYTTAIPLQIHKGWHKNCILQLQEYNAFLGNSNNYENNDLQILDSRNLYKKINPEKSHIAFKVKDLSAILDCAFEDSSIMFETVRKDFAFQFKMAMDEADLHDKIVPLDFEKINGKWHLVYCFAFEGTQNQRKFRVKLPEFVTGDEFCNWVAEYAPFVCAREIEYIYKKGATGLPSLDVLLKLLDLPKDMRKEYGIHGPAIDAAISNVVQLPEGCALRTTEDKLFIQLPNKLQIEIARDLQRQCQLGNYDANEKLMAIANTAKYVNTNLLNAHIENGYFELYEGGFIARAFDAPIITMTFNEEAEMKASKEMMEAHDAPDTFKGKTVANVRAELHKNLQNRVGGVWTNIELTKNRPYIASESEKEVVPSKDCIPAYAKARDKIGSNFNAQSTEEAMAFENKTNNLLQKLGSKINAADINAQKALDQIPNDVLLKHATRLKQMENEAKKHFSIEEQQPFSSRIADAICPNVNAQSVPNLVETEKKEQNMSIGESLGSAATTAANVVKDNAIDIAKSLGEQAMIAGLRHFIRTTVLVPALKSSPMARLLTTGKLGGTRLGKWYAKRKVDAFMDRWISGNPLALIVLEYVSIWGAPRLLRSFGLLPESGNAVISYLDEALTREAKRVGNSFMANFAEGFIDRAISGMSFGKPELGAQQTAPDVKVTDHKIDR